MLCAVCQSEIDDDDLCCEDIGPDGELGTHRMCCLGRGNDDLDFSWYEWVKQPEFKVPEGL